MAMLLRESGESLAEWNIRLIASGFSIKLLAKAQRRLYTQMEINRGLPASLLVKYFRQSGPHWQIAMEIQKMVEFQEINLVKSWPRLPRMDLIFMASMTEFNEVGGHTVTKASFKKDAFLYIFEKMVRPERFQLPTFWFVARAVPTNNSFHAKEDVGDSPFRSLAHCS